MNTQPVIYPGAPSSDTQDRYHSTIVEDPYRPLEQPDSLETADWIRKQNELTFHYLDEICERDDIRERLTNLYNQERYSNIFFRGARYFYFKNTGIQNQSVLYTLSSLDGEPELVLDPNLFSADGTTALSGISVSNDGRYLAYGLSRSGSDWQEWKVREIDSGTDLDDLLLYIKFSGVSWTGNDSGFFYSRYDEPQEGAKKEDQNYFQKLYYHKLGDLQSNDLLVYSDEEHKERGFSGIVTDDGRYLIISISNGTDTKNRISVKNLSIPDSEVVSIISEFNASYSFIDNDGNNFFFLTDMDAPKGRIIELSLEKPAEIEWNEVISESENAIQSVNLVYNQFIVSYLQDAHSLVSVYDSSGEFYYNLEFPSLCTASGFEGKKEESETFYSIARFTMPTTHYKLNLVTGKSTLIRQTLVDFSPEDYETHQIFYTSADGSRIPMFLIYRKETVLDGRAPTILYGYGGFKISILPYFSQFAMAWMQMGGIYAVANIRGGGEYGEEWHREGTKLKKQNVFDDFLSAAQWLISNQYTSRLKLAIQGGSNGGLLVGACMTQRPELFAAALPSVGVMDMLRFNKFTIGWAWESDYGSPEDPIEFEALHAYSPLHNIKKGVEYPASFITTGDHDDRVVPAHSFKFAAALQAAQSGSNPILIRIETQAGHGAGKPLTKLINEQTDILAFLTRIMNISAS